MVDKISRARKKELEQPDPFMETMQAGLDYCIRHKKQVIWAVSIVLTIIVVISITMYSIQSSEHNASALLAETLNMYNKQEDPVKGYNMVESNFKKILEKYSNTAAGRLAGVDFAAISYKAGKFKQAHSLYLTGLDNFGDDPAIKNLLLDSLGHTCEAEKKYDEAKKYFKEIADGNLPFLRPEALFNLGMLDYLNGHKKDGVEAFKKIVAEYADSMYTPLAKSRIACSK